MTDTNPTRLLGLALVAIGLAEFLGFIVEPLFTRRAELDLAILGLPAGAALLLGRTAWIRPALRALQVVVAAVTLLIVAALLGALPIPVRAETDLHGGYRVVAVALLIGQGALWVWALGLGRRLVATRDAA